MSISSIHDDIIYVMVFKYSAEEVENESEAFYRLRIK